MAMATATLTAMTGVTKDGTAQTENHAMTMSTCAQTRSCAFTSSVCVTECTTASVCPMKQTVVKIAVLAEVIGSVLTRRSVSAVARFVTEKDTAGITQTSMIVSNVPDIPMPFRVMTVEGVTSTRITVTARRTAWMAQMRHKAARENVRRH